MYLLRFLCPKSPPLIPLRHSSTPPFSATVASLIPAILITTCSHHHIPTRAPGALSDPLHWSNSDCVAIYWATIFWRCQGARPLPVRFLPRKPPRHPSCHLVLNPPPLGPFPCGGWPPRSPIKRGAPPALQIFKRRRTPSATPTHWWGFASSSSIPPSPRSSSLPLPAFHCLPPPSSVSGIWRRSPSIGRAHRRWNTWRWPPSNPLLLISVTSALLPICTVLCIVGSHSGPSMAP